MRGPLTVHTYTHGYVSKVGFLETYELITVEKAPLVTDPDEIFPRTQLTYH